jgi:hypothetical protein
MPDPTAADRLALALCGVIDPATGTCATGEICRRCRRDAAAVARELAEQVVPEEPDKFQHFTNEAIRLNRMGTRAEILALAAELGGGSHD